MIDSRGTRDLGAYFLELEGLLDRIERSSNHYQVLGIDRSATGDEINAAHKLASALLNPVDVRLDFLDEHFLDRLDDAAEKLIQAHVVLSHFGARVEYDNSLNQKVRVPITFTIPDVTLIRVVPPNGEPLIVSSPTTPIETLDMTKGEPYRDLDTKHSGGKRASDSDAISIKHGTGGQVVYTKLVDKLDRGNRRRYHRLRLSVPTYVTGYDRSKGKWTEVAHTLDVSVGGLALQLDEDMREGSVLHLILPMPTKLRRHGHSDPTYQVYGIVRRIDESPDEKHVVGLEFLGGSPPPGYLEKPWARFQTRW
jgi:hypothetical protein